MANFITPLLNSDSNPFNENATPSGVMAVIQNREVQSQDDAFAIINNSESTLNSLGQNKVSAAVRGGMDFLEGDNIIPTGTITGQMATVAGAASRIENIAKNVDIEDTRGVLVNANAAAHDAVRDLSTYGAAIQQLSDLLMDLGKGSDKASEILSNISHVSNAIKVESNWTDSNNPAYLAYYTLQRLLKERIRSTNLINDIRSKVNSINYGNVSRSELDRFNGVDNVTKAVMSKDEDKKFPHNPYANREISHNILKELGKNSKSVIESDTSPNAKWKYTQLYGEDGRWSTATSSQYADLSRDLGDSSILEDTSPNADNKKYTYFNQSSKWAEYTTKLLASLASDSVVVENTLLKDSKVSSDLDEYFTLYMSCLNELKSKLTSGDKITGNKNKADYLNFNSRSSINFGGTYNYIGGVYKNMSPRTDYFWDIFIKGNSKLPPFPYAYSSDFHVYQSHVGYAHIPAMSLSFNDITVGGSTDISLPRNFGNMSLASGLTYPTHMTISVLDTDKYLVDQWWKNYLAVTVGDPMKVLPIKDRAYIAKVYIMTPQMDLVFTRTFAVVPKIDTSRFSGKSSTTPIDISIDFTIIGMGNEIPTELTNGFSDRGFKTLT